MIDYHCSSSKDWLRIDLLNKLENPLAYEIIDLIDQPIPERFKHSCGLIQEGKKLNA